MEINKIYNESCLQTLCGMDAVIDLTITSPPYNVGIDYDGYNDKMPFAEYKEFCTQFLSLLLDKTKEGGRLCLNVNNTLRDWENNKMLSCASFFTSIAESVGWEFREHITWVKMIDETGEIFAGGKTAWGSWMSASNPQLRSFTEPILVFHKGSAKKRASRGKRYYKRGVYGLDKKRLVHNARQG